MAVRKPKEGDLVKAVIQWLTLQGWMAWRNNTGAKKIGKHFVCWGHVGSGDVFALRDGVFLSIECKLPGKYPTAVQKQWIDAVNVKGGVAGVVRSIEDLQRMVEALDA